MKGIFSVQLNFLTPAIPETIKQTNCILELKKIHNSRYPSLHANTNENFTVVRKS